VVATLRDVMMCDCLRVPPCHPYKQEWLGSSCVRTMLTSNDKTRCRPPCTILRDFHTRYTSAVYLQTNPPPTQGFALFLYVLCHTNGGQHEGPNPPQGWGPFSSLLPKSDTGENLKFRVKSTDIYFKEIGMPSRHHVPGGCS